MPAFLVAVTAQPASAAEVGYVGPGFSGATAPTGQKPQSKLWYTGGYWWGAMFNGSVGDWHIYRLDWPTQTWKDTGVLLDERHLVTVDVLWDGSRLYVVAAGTDPVLAADSARVYRFSFNSAANTYSRDAGYPVTPVTGGMEAIVVDKDSTGRLWLTWTRGNAVYVTHSTGSPTSWVTPYVVPVPGANPVDPDDISSVIAFGGNKIGVMWGNQTNDAYYFAVHVDGAADSAWTQEVVYSSPKGADDHMNVKVIQNDAQGRVFAVIKTSKTGANEPLNLLVVRNSNGSWDVDNVVGRYVDDQSRALLVVDSDNQDVYVFSVAPCCSGGTVYMKKASIASLLSGNPFPSGLGTVFMQSTLNPKINNPSSTKQTVTNASDLVVLAGDDGTKTYVHNKIDLGPAESPPQTSIASAPTSTVQVPSVTFSFAASKVGSTFQCRVDAGSFTACASPVTYTSLSAGNHSFAVRAIDPKGYVDPTPATAAFTVALTYPAAFTASADTQADATHPTTTYGTATSITSDSSPNVVGYAAFQVGGTTGRVTKAVLRVYSTNGTVNAPAVYRVTSAWNEASLTWNAQPSRAATATADLGAVGTGTWIEYDVTSAVPGDGLVSFALVPQSTDALVASSREASTNKPQLRITAGG